MVQKNILAALLIFGIFMLIPRYMEMIGMGEQEPQTTSLSENDNNKAVPVEAENSSVVSKIPASSSSSGALVDIITIETPLYRAEISNQSGGSIVGYELLDVDGDEYRYLGSYNSIGEYDSNQNVVLMHNFNPSQPKCSPCLASEEGGQFVQLTQPFDVLPSPELSNGVLRVASGETKKITYIGNGVEKVLTVSGSSYEMVHQFNYDLSSSTGVEVVWSAGLFPSEPSIHPSKSYSSDELTYSSVYGYQGGGLESITQSSQADVPEKLFNQPTEWVAMRTKFFGAVLIPSKQADYIKLSSKNLLFRGQDDILPLYSAALGGYGSRGSINVKTYLGPLDVEHVDILTEDSSVSSIMNFGWSIIKPFSRLVLWTIKSLHNTLGLNYGIVLIVIAVMMRFITGPLTKKSYESSAKMKVVAPLQKKIQEKHKNDPQKLQQEMGKLWKEHGVNPVSGCLPMLVQWPILMSFFIVFRSTIEFRGASFFGWITDLSQPDYLFALPFEIPLYGGAVAILPILMGISMFLTMRITMASTDDTQKTFMYFMNGFFILIFNSFPSGLTLYYTIFNFLSYQQQISIKNSK